MNKFFVFNLLFWSFSVWAVADSTKTKLKSETKSQQKTATEEEKDFVPSLSQTLNDNSRLKSEIKRQLAENLDPPLKQSDTEKKHLKKDASEPPISKTIHFEDLEVSISQRSEENPVKIKEEEKTN